MRLDKSMLAVSSCIHVFSKVKIKCREKVSESFSQLVEHTHTDTQTLIYTQKGTMNYRGKASACKGKKARERERERESE